MAENISLEFLGAQMDRMLAGQAAPRGDIRGLPEDMHVLTAIVLRHESMLKDTLAQITAMVSQHQRFSDRLRRLEEHSAE